jgi:hypothetical protein
MPSPNEIEVSKSRRKTCKRYIALNGERDILVGNSETTWNTAGYGKIGLKGTGE